jgi:hypothetical protein
MTTKAVVNRAYATASASKSGFGVEKNFRILRKLGNWLVSDPPQLSSVCRRFLSVSDLSLG